MGHLLASSSKMRGTMSPKVLENSVKLFHTTKSEMKTNK